MGRKPRRLHACREFVACRVFCGVCLFLLGFVCSLFVLLFVSASLSALSFNIYACLLCFCCPFSILSPCRLSLLFVLLFIVSSLSPFLSFISSVLVSSMYKHLFLLSTQRQKHAARSVCTPHGDSSLHALFGFFYQWLSITLSTGAPT